jgi:hypothetical protein
MSGKDGLKLPPVHVFESNIIFGVSSSFNKRVTSCHTCAGMTCTTACTAPVPPVHTVVVLRLYCLYCLQVHVPEGLTALDLDIIKLTAQFVARNGVAFLTGLTQREANNPQVCYITICYVISCQGCHRGMSDSMGASDWQ